MARTLKVKEIEGEKVLTFHVESRSQPDQEHFVNLASNNGYGFCSCKNWQCNIWPIVRDKTFNRMTKRSTCPHIRAAAHYFLMFHLDLMIEHYAKDEKTDPA